MGQRRNRPPNGGKKAARKKGATKKPSTRGTPRTPSNVSDPISGRDTKGPAKMSPE